MFVEKTFEKFLFDHSSKFNPLIKCCPPRGVNLTKIFLGEILWGFHSHDWEIRLAELKNTVFFRIGAVNCIKNP